MTKQEAILISAYTGCNLYPDFDEIKKYVFEKTGMLISKCHYKDSSLKKIIQKALQQDIENLVTNVIV